MQVTITGRHFEVTAPIKKHIMDKLKRLNRYENDIIDAHIILSVEDCRHSAEIVLLLRDTKILSKDETADMYTSIDKTVLKMEHQLKAHKERLRDTKRHKESRLKEKRQNQDEIPSVVKDTDFLHKPMSTEEAALELELQEFEFFVFKDVDDHDKVKVIYKRKDKHLGLIEPE